MVQGVSAQAVSKQDDVHVPGRLLYGRHHMALQVFNLGVKSDLHDPDQYVMPCARRCPECL